MISRPNMSLSRPARGGEKNQRTSKSLRELPWAAACRMALDAALTFHLRTIFVGAHGMNKGLTTWTPDAVDLRLSRSARTSRSLLRTRDKSDTRGERRGAGCTYVTDPRGDHLRATS